MNHYIRPEEADHDEPLREPICLESLSSEKKMSGEVVVSVLVYHKPDLGSNFNNVKCLYE